MNAGPLVLWLLAAEPPPLPPEAPAVFIATTVRVHLRASEELEPDLLRALARKNVTLWLSTRTNTLRASTLETINQFGAAWIMLRSPVRESDGAQLNQVPTAGVWLDVRQLEAAGRVLGPRRLALELHGALDAALFEKLQRLRPFETTWHAAPEVDLLSWGLFRQLPGRKVLVRSSFERWPAECPRNPSAAEPTLQARLGSVLEASGGSFPCGKAPRIEVPLEVDRAALHQLLIREPSAELVIDVGEDPKAVSRARRLFDALGVR